jgi:acyl-CoA thioester hydrolase
VSDLPTYDQIVQLPAVDAQVVSPEFIDLNGHMNIRHYFDAASIGLWRACIAAGMDQSYSDERGLTLFTVEQHIRYFSELRLGERFTVHGRFLERSDRAVHAMSFVVAPETESLACTFEAAYVHVDMNTRRSVPIPDDVAARFDDEIAAGDALGWEAPVSGAMGVRRR